MATPRYWAVVPAAGAGRRMGSDLPKQYLPLQGRPVIEHTLERLLAHPRIQGVAVALAEDDPHWEATRCARHRAVRRVSGGSERCHSVLNALEALAREAAAEDWVLVHDGARPCLRRADMQRLMDRLQDHPVGGLLGMPVRDTVKRVGPGDEVLATVAREGLWQAFTPQMFRLGPLRAALRGALHRGQLVTDDASAMELAGYRPRMLEGHSDNIKITRPGDLVLADFYLSLQEREDADRPGI